MKARLAVAAAARLAQDRALQTGALAEAQKALWQALKCGDIPEAQRQSEIVRSICGPVPPSPLVEQLLVRLRVLKEYRERWPCTARS